MSNHISSNLFIFLTIAVIAGALVPFQAGSNAFLGKALGHPLWATVVSLVVSLAIVLSVIVTMKVQPMNLTGIGNIPWWAWFGGVAGVIYITAALVLTPKLGATTFIVCVITGQVMVSLLIDHFGLLGLPVKEVNLGRIIGITLIISGMIMVQYFTSGKTTIAVGSKEQPTTSVVVNK
ncbi:DMT family transporter [Photobacterium atrarenae]|uniref:DMT family transporter n=1 Tax=Photobacterium atrarenae TaxID=865757 RepID=A0ABY5GB11_9GAMM|nr:DMT family transporter [Photobacterium atrarenae]UTV26362.1 DMT family transporter [Photobacterium atrarenae]